MCGPPWRPRRAHSLSLPGQVWVPSKFASKGLVLECPRLFKQVVDPQFYITWLRLLLFSPFCAMWAGKVTRRFYFHRVLFGTLVFRAGVGSSLQSHCCVHLIFVGPASPIFVPLPSMCIECWPLLFQVLFSAFPEFFLCFPCSRSQFSFDIFPVRLPAGTVAMPRSSSPNMVLRGIRKCLLCLLSRETSLQGLLVCPFDTKEE